jgi:hypothetical protein
LTRKATASSRGLIKYQGLRRVFNESFTPEQTGFKEEISRFPRRQAEPHQEALRWRHKGTQGLLEELAAEDEHAVDRRGQGEAVAKEIARCSKRNRLHW